MLLLQWLWIGNGQPGEMPPIAVFWTLRVLMFIISFVLEDWAIHELIQSPRHRRIAVLLVASSYVTWTYQTHTFSNSIETLIVAWSMVLVQRIVESPVSCPIYPPKPDVGLCSVRPVSCTGPPPRPLHPSLKLTLLSVATLFPSSKHHSRHIRRLRYL